MAYLLSVFSTLLAFADAFEAVSLGHDHSKSSEWQGQPQSGGLGLKSVIF